MKVDLLISGATVLTGACEPPLSDTSVAVAGDQIVALGPRHRVDPTVSPDRRIEGTDRLLMPGLIDAHAHLALTLVRGLAHRPGHPVYDLMWPLEAALDPEAVRDLAALGAADALLSGTTCVADHYFFAESVVEAALDLGLRIAPGHTVMTLAGPRTGPSERDAAEQLVDRYREHPLVHPTVAPHAPDTVDDATLLELFALARDRGVPTHLHLAQTERELATIAQRSGRSPVAHLEALGLLDQAVVAAHCSYIDEADLERLVAHEQLTPVYCPTVHALDGRVQPAAEILARRGRLALGTDAPPDEAAALLGEMAAAVTGQGVLTGRPRALSPASALELATGAGARALGLDDRIGELAVGRQADLVVIRTDTARTAPLGDPAAFVVLAAGSRQVELVTVAGRVVVDGGRLVEADEGDLVERARHAARRVAQRAGLAG